jgi:hypothetical protein
MKIVISNKSKIGLGQVVVNNKNLIGKVNFSRIARVITNVHTLASIGDVNVIGQRDGDVLVYNANTNTYNIQTLPNIDGGIF